MNPLVIVELALRIWLRILETTPADVLEEQARDNWQNFKKVVEWMDKLGIDKPKPEPTPEG
jgi:hypothetical protein